MRGFWKFFKTNMPACSPDGDFDKDLLLGHYMSYHKPTEAHLIEVNRRAVPVRAVVLFPMFEHRA